MSASTNIPFSDSRSHSALMRVLSDAGLDPKRISRDNFDESGYDEILLDRKGNRVIDPRSSFAEHRRSLCACKAVGK